jgi:hypothetical protein
MEAEYGSSFDVRFLQPSQSSLVDSEGNEVMCKCGKPGGTAILGKGAFVAYCADCGPFTSPHAAYIYRRQDYLSPTATEAAGVDVQN